MQTLNLMTLNLWALSLLHLSFQVGGHPKLGTRKLGDSRGRNPETLTKAELRDLGSQGSDFLGSADILQAKLADPRNSGRL